MRRKRQHHHRMLSLAALMLFALPTAAPAAEFAASSDIGGSFFSGAEGSLAVNASAGDLNQQFNGASVARSSTDTAAPSVVAVQELADTGKGPDVGIAIVRDQAFADSAGLIRINQASGLGNLQANGVIIAVGVQVEGASDVILQQTRAAPELPPAAEMDPGALSAFVAETAFQGAQGIVQVNQTGGSGNASANALALRFQAGAIQ